MIMRIPIQSMKQPRIMMMINSVMNTPQRPRPKPISRSVMTWPHPAFRKAPVNMLEAMAMKMIMAVMRSVR